MRLLYRILAIYRRTALKNEEESRGDIIFMEKIRTKSQSLLSNILIVT